MAIYKGGTSGEATLPFLALGLPASSAEREELSCLGHCLRYLVVAALANECGAYNCVVSEEK